MEQKSKAEQWEFDAIGKFLLELYQNLVFGVRSDWMVPKNVLRAKFTEYLRDKSESSLRKRFVDACSTSDVGALLSRSNYLINTPRGSEFFRIRSATLFKYSNKIIEELDEKRKNGETTEFIANDDDSQPAINGDPALIDNLRVDANAPTHALVYEGSQQQERTSSFQLTNMGCFICQMNFGSPNSFEEHVEKHGDESDFTLLKNYHKSVMPIFKISYNICKNSHYFRFNLEATHCNIVIEKLVIVQTRTFYYVHNTRVPYALGVDRKDHFFVDSHLFRKGVVQPIVVVFHEQSNKQKRYVEQHHFCRVEEFPVVKLSINPCRLPNKIKFKPKFKLPQYMPPNEIRRALQTDLIEGPLCEISNEFQEYLNNDKTMNQQNMRTVLLRLLQIEDWDTMREYSRLVQRNVKLRKYDNEYIIKLKIPKHIRFENIIFPYDDVIVLPVEESTIIPNTLDDLMNKMDQLIDDSNNEAKKKKTKCYYGQIKCVSYGRVTFACDKKIPDEKLFTVLFRPSRMVTRYQYRALEQLIAMPGNVVKKFLFPEQVMIREILPTSLSLRNKNIYKNPEQYQAIQCIVNDSVEKMAPYIIFGPPGTGKTTTLVEAILQLYTLQPRSRILVTAGSNGACDEIALRLCKLLAPLNETQIITRIYSRSYENRSENINELLLENSNLYADHFLPDVDVLHSYRIVVCTLSIIGRLSTGKFGKHIDGSGVFTHVFVDEVAASTEAETLVGIITTLSSESSLIISGDHRQLGPILNSNRAADLGLEVSLMERLLKRDCYDVDANGRYNQQIQTRLCRNFRSHPEIVNLYSEMYYDGRLIAEADTDVQKLCRDWHRAPNAEYPIIFHSIFGPEQRDQNSTSRYNPLEVQAVMDYVRDLLFFGIKGQKIVQSDIGIITPYKKQYLRIQDELNLRNWYQIECGAVESFQGKEKNIIIVSFVRSFTKNLGFLDSKRRLNVTLSRARSLLILIGNPRTLSINTDFKHIIEQCQEHKTLVGAVYQDGDILDRAAAKELNNAKVKKLTNSMEKLSVSAENLRDDGDAKVGTSKKAKSRAQRRRQNNRPRKMTPTEEEKAKLCKEMCAASNNFIKNNTTATESHDIVELLNGLPRVPTRASTQQQQQQQEQQRQTLHIDKQHFQITNRNINEDHDQIQERINKLLRKPATTTNVVTPTTTNVPKMQTTSNQRPTTVPTRPSYIKTTTTFHLNSATTTSNARTNPLAAATPTPINQRSMNYATTSSPSSSSTTTTPLRQPIIHDRVAFGRTEYPSTPSYMRATPKPPQPPPKSKSKSKCIIA